MKNPGLKTKKFWKIVKAVSPAVFSLAILSVPVAVYAATGYAPLESSVTNTEKVTSFGDYLKRIYQLGISVTIALAVLYLVIGGFGYMTSGTNITSKETARSHMTNAIYGLLLALLSYVILNTISPQFTKFSLDIGEVGKGFNKVTSTGGVSGSSSSGCFDCSTLNNVPVKPGICDNGVCQLNKGFAEKLAGFNSETGGWRVTEAYPPTTTHLDPCHNNGTCVDANFTSSPTPDKIKTYIETAQKNGLRAVYEVSDEKTAESLRKATGLPADKIISAKITAPHFSVYNI